MTDLNNKQKQMINLLQARIQNLNFAIPINEVLSVEIGSYSEENAFKDFELFYKGKNAHIGGNRVKAPQDDEFCI